MVTDNQIKEVKSYEDFKRIECKGWPEEIHKAAFVTEGNPIKTNRDADLLPLCDSTPGLANVCSVGMENMFVKRFPEIKDCEGKIELIIITTRRLREGQQKDGSLELKSTMMKRTFLIL